MYIPNPISEPPRIDIPSEPVQVVVDDGMFVVNVDDISVEGWWLYVVVDGGGCMWLMLACFVFVVDACC